MTFLICRKAERKFWIITTTRKSNYIHEKPHCLEKKNQCVFRFTKNQQHSKFSSA